MIDVGTIDKCLRAILKQLPSRALHGVSPDTYLGFHEIKAQINEMAAGRTGIIRLADDFRLELYWDRNEHTLHARLTWAPVAIIEDYEVREEV